MLMYFFVKIADTAEKGIYHVPYHSILFIKSSPP